MHSLFRFADLAVLLIRAGFGFRLIYGTVDNLISYPQMLEFAAFLEHHGFPIPLISAFVSVILQFLAGVSWIIGFKVRWFSAVMVINFIVAILAVHIGDTYLNTSAAIHLLIIALFLLTHGPGKYTIEKFAAKKNVNKL